ncbi:hypothetical protein CEK29_11020 [Bordetella genomosp. 5]|uniref:hypothetical protein n=1 Tax=Bordetella genomosp. 5 TaxID=1395608 RepID=UPI000BDCFC43|nr:hypothetical protein CEK29_11020 [Bordetella genomosp. 5]
MQVRRGFLKLALRQALAGTALLTMAAFAGPVAQAAQTKDGKTTITVGISVGSAEKIFDVVKQVAARDGLEIELIKFNDYQLPNEYHALGLTHFILSGQPHVEEAYWFAEGAGAELQRRGLWQPA